MRPYAVIDMHCDTLTECKYTNTGNPDTLDDPKRVLSLGNMPSDVKWAQFYAIWIQDENRGADAVNFFSVNADNFDRQIELFSDRVVACRSASDIEKAWADGKRAAILTVENGSALGGDINNVKYLHDRGVRCITLVWNFDNEIGTGVKGGDAGFKDFGRQVIPEMEKYGILADVSHLNDTGFYELLEIAAKPFVATHSNARSLCSHARNLTDDMIVQMVKRDCLIGLNYYTNFICDDGSCESPDTLYRHICRFFELGAEKNLALGSDFDGSVLPEWLNSPEKVAEFYDYIISRGLSQEQADGIFYANALGFLKKNLG